MANFAVENGVTVSMIKFKGEYANVDIVGTVPNKTKGIISSIDPESQVNDFESVLKEDIIATKAQIKINLHKAL